MAASLTRAGAAGLSARNLDYLDEHLRGYVSAGKLAGTLVVIYRHGEIAHWSTQGFRDRERDPFRQYKLTPEDWRNRAKWNDYAAAVEDMLALTSTEPAPWTVVEADDKFHARVKVLSTLNAALERALED